MAKKRKKQTDTAAVLFGIYGIIMLYLLFIRGRTAVEGVPYWEQVLSNYNLTPFHTIHNYWHILTNKAYYMEKWGAVSIYRYNARHAFINLAGNVVMFLPLGALLPAANGKLRKFLRTFFASAALILTVEILQLFTLLGSCDVDDLILNMAGVSLGYLLWKLCRKGK